MKSKVKLVLLIILMLISLVGIALTVNNARENKQEKLIIASLSFISDTIVSLLILSFKKEKAIAFCFPIFPGVSIISLPKATTVPPFIIYPASVSIPASPPTSLPRTKRVPPFITAFPNSNNDFFMF